MLRVKTNKIQRFLYSLSKNTVKSWLGPIGKYCTKLWFWEQLCLPSLFTKPSVV